MSILSRLRGTGSKERGPGGKSGIWSLRRLLVVLLVLLFGALVLSFVYLFSEPTRGQQITYSELDRLASGSAGQVVSATFLDEDSLITGTYCAVPPMGACPAASTRDFWTAYPRSDATTAQLLGTLSAHATVSVDPQPGKAVVRFVSQFVLPLLILADLFGIIFLTRGGQGGIGDIAGFGAIGRDRARKRRISTAVTFADVAGAEEAVAELREVKDYLADPQRYERFGAQPPKGVLLFGAPGCGKTLLARAVAGEAGVPFFSISGAEFVESLVGVGAARVRDLFRQVREVAPAIVFIDELDAAARRRTGEGASGGEREQTLNQLLVEMDGFEVTAGIVVMGATNRPDIIDPALLRPGRFDRHITVEEPDVHGREAILALHARNKPMAADVDLALLARATPGFTGADLANVINEGALLAIRGGHPDVRMGELQEGIQRVLSGPKRRGRLLTDEERRRLAVHESGHAVVAAAVGRPEEVQRVSIVARGRGLGQSTVSGDADRVLHTRGQMEDQMTVALAGMCAEELRFGEPSSAAENDIERATGLARQMAGRYGMSADIGIRLLASDVDLYLGGGDGTGLATVSEQTLQLFDSEVRRLFEAARLRATHLLEVNRASLDQLTQIVERVETVEGPELAAQLASVRSSAASVAAQT